MMEEKTSWKLIIIYLFVNQIGHYHVWVFDVESPYTKAGLLKLSTWYNQFFFFFIYQQINWILNYKT